MNAEMDFQKSLWTGQWAFNFDVVAGSNLASSDILSVRLEPQHSRGWTVTLMEFRYRGGTMAAGHRPNLTTNPTMLAQALVTWGTDTAFEQAVIDYPARGCTFVVHGAMVRMSLTSIFQVNSNPPFPTLGGWISPSVSSGRAFFPTYTTGRQNMGPNATLDFDIPARAIGYRFLPVDRSGATVSVKLRQLEPILLDVVRDDGTYIVTSAPPSPPNLGEYAPGYYSIARDASYLRVVTDVANDASAIFTLQFLLDLG